METSSSLSAVLIVLAGGLAILGLAGVWIGRRLNRTIVLGVSVAHLIVCVLLFSVAFGLGDAQRQVPWLLTGALYVLSTPLMYLLYLGPDLLGGRWWGDDSTIIFALLIVNSLLWGTAVAWLVKHVRGRHAG